MGEIGGIDGGEEKNLPGSEFFAVYIILRCAFSLRGNDSSQPAIPPKYRISGQGRTG
jgi:hypothetical protein